MIQAVAIRPQSLDPGWLRLIQFAQDHPYSTLKVSFREGIPHIGEEIIESIKFS